MKLNIFPRQKKSVAKKQVLDPYSQDFIFFVTYEYGSKKPKVFVLGKPFHASLMFVGKFGAYPSEAPFHSSLVCFAHNHYTSLEGLARNKHSSLFGPLVSYKEN
jgi:hypothetical protein